MEAGDHRDTTGVLMGLSDPEPRVQLAALSRLASFGLLNEDTVLIPWFDNENASHRSMAYHAAGQMGCERCVASMMDKLASETDEDALMDLYESIGKMGRLLWDNKLDSLVAHSAGHQRGAAWHLYRCGLRGDVSELDVDRAVQLLRSSDTETRLGAAHFLARTSDLDLTRYLSDIEAQFLTEVDRDVQIALASSFRHVNGVLAASVLEGAMQNAALHALVRVQSIRAYRGVKRKNQLLIHSLCLDPHHQVRATAAGLLSEVGGTPVQMKSLYVNHLKTYPGSIPPAEIQGAYIATNPEDLDAFMKAIPSAEGAYARAANVAALREAPHAPQILNDWLIQDPAPIVRTTACETLIAFAEMGDPELTPPMMVDIAELVMATGDVTAMGLMADHLSNPDLDYKEHLAHWQWMQDARNELTLPAAFETAVSLDRAIAYFEGQEFQQSLPEWNTHVNWEAIANLESHPQVRVETNKGSVVLELDVLGAPSVAANFLNLVDEGYFEGKSFHRVLPNFVAQTGCPRGDGWGSVNYTIRSDFGPHRYRTGSVGMASLGPDTESCQWFIVHSPTPHLEGRYSVFAHVVEGMEVVQTLTVGDRIESVSKTSYEAPEGL